MHKVFGVIFLAASFAFGYVTWRIWYEMGEHNSSMLLLPPLGLGCFFLLVVGVKFMIGQNPILTMWRRDDD